jgi:hypothetical protein
VEVKSAVYFGSQTEYEVETDAHLLTVIDSDPQAGHLYCKGSRVSLTVDASRGYVLPNESDSEPAPSAIAERTEHKVPPLDT